jgi:hypothetical protein
MVFKSKIKLLKSKSQGTSLSIPSVQRGGPRNGCWCRAVREFAGLNATFKITLRTFVFCHNTTI